MFLSTVTIRAKELVITCIVVKTYCMKVKFNLDFSNLRNLSLGPTPDLDTLSLEGCSNLLQVHMSQCPKLTVLKLNGSELRTLYLGLTLDLETLSLEGCNVAELHMPSECPKLKFIRFHNSKLRKLNLGLTPKLEILSLSECYNLEEVHIPFPCPNLKSLSFDNPKLKKLKIEQVPDLEALCLGGCYDLVELCMPFRCLNLKSINLSNSKLRTLDLGLTQNLERLDLKDCSNLVDINAPDGCLEKLVYLDLSGCGRFKSFLFDKQSKPLKVGSLSELHLIGESIDTCPLHPDNSFPKFLFTCFYKEDPAASSFGNLEKLISIGQCVCANFESFSRSICGLNFLRKLTLEGSLLEVPEDIHHLECLEELTVSNTKIEHLPESVCRLKQLKCIKLIDCNYLSRLPKNFGNLKCLEELSLKLRSCWDLDITTDFGELESLEKLVLSSTGISRLPASICMMKRLIYLELECFIIDQKLQEDLWRLQCLEKLILRGCEFSGGLPKSIFELKRLKYFHLLYCKLDDFPEELGHLICLEELDITGTNIRHLPQSIFQLKGLRIIGSKRTLELRGLTPVKRTSDNGDYDTFCYTVV